MISIREKENKLFAEWKESVPSLVADGVVNESEYNLAKYKIVYVLKEVNGGNVQDLRGFLAKCERWQSWDNIARWTQGIFNIDTNYKWEKLIGGTDELRQKYLPKICAMNVKKTSGGHTTNNSELKSAAKRDREFLKKQLDLYEPDFAIFCGTSTRFLGELNWKQTSRGIEYSKYNETIIISYAHPEARIADCLLYYGLIDAVTEILNEK